MTPAQIEENLKLLQLAQFIEKSEIQLLPSTFLEGEEICFAFNAKEVIRTAQFNPKENRNITQTTYLEWTGFITQSRIIMLKKSSSGTRTKIISIEKISSLENNSKTLILHGNGEKTELKMETAASCHISYHVINAALNKQDIVDAIQKARATLPKEPMPEFVADLIAKLMAGAVLVGLFLLIKSCFFGGDEDKAIKSKPAESGYSLPSNISIINRLPYGITSIYFL